MSDIQDEAYTEAMQEIDKLGDKVQYLEGQIADKNALLKRAADALEVYLQTAAGGTMHPFIAELRKAAE